MHAQATAHCLLMSAEHMLTALATADSIASAAGCDHRSACSAAHGNSDGGVCRVATQCAFHTDCQTNPHPPGWPE